MTWIELALADLNEARAAPIITAVQTTVLGSGQPDPIPFLISQVVQEIRGAIGFSGKFPLDGDSDDSLPPNLKDMAVQKICRVAKGRVNMALNETERQDESVYQTRLKMILDGKYPIDIPDNPATVNPSLPQGAVTNIRGFRREFTRSTLRNL